MENLTLDTISDDDEIFKFRNKICLFFVSSIIYSGFILANNFAYVHTYKSIKELLTEFFIYILLFIPYFLIFRIVVKGSIKVKNKIFSINKRHKIRDIFQIIFTVLLSIPSLFLGIIPILIYSVFGIHKIIEVIFHI